MTTPLNEDEKIDEILEQLQYGTQMSDNEEPMLTNNRNIAKQSILALLSERDRLARIDELELHLKALYNTPSELNDVLAIPLKYRIKELSKLKKGK